MAVATESVKPGKIFGAIAGVIADVGHVGKDKLNQQMNFRYRSIDDVFNALHPALAKNKVFIIPQILERNTEVLYKTKNGLDMLKVICKIKFTFYAEDGSSVYAINYGEGMDTGDKATNKAMSIAYKYACFQVFCIPTEEMEDPDSESLEHDKESGKAAEEVKNKKTSRKSAGKEKPEKDSDARKETEAERDVRITQAMVNTISAELKRTGVTESQLLDLYHVKDLKELKEIGRAHV